MVSVPIFSGRGNKWLASLFSPQVLSVSIFEKTPILQAFCDWDYTNDNTTLYNQLSLFDL